MNEDSFFKALETQYSNQLPFVVYSRPINGVIKSWLQNDDTLHKTETFTESGFVFAPFDFSQQSIVLPETVVSFKDSGSSVFQVGISVLSGLS